MKFALAKKILRIPLFQCSFPGVDTDTILRQAEGIDNRGNRIRLMREMVFAQLGLASDETECTYSFTWKNTKRTCTILFMNIRELSDFSFENFEENWKLIIDFPFDETGRNPKDDLARIQEFLEDRADGTKTICWIPRFFSEDVQTDLGKLVTLNHVLSGDRLSEYATHLSPQDKQTAKSLLENQRSILRQQFQNHMDAVYGISNSFPDSIDQTHPLEANEQFVSLRIGLELRPPAAANLAAAMAGLLNQALEHEFPAAPQFEADVNRVSNLDKVYSVVGQAVQDPQGRAEVDKGLRGLVRQIANPLLLGEMGQDATHFVLGQHWKNHFNRKSAEAGGAIQVGQLRRWIDEPKAMGLPAEVQNLVILAYADQTSRSFYRHNQPFEPTLKNLPTDCELREQKLPDKDQWETAVRLANDIFKVSVSPLCKASTVAELERRVREKSVNTVESCQNYVSKLQEVISRLGLSTNGDRLTTARATAALVERMKAKPEDEVISVLTSAEIATTATAMGECLSNAQGLTGTFRWYKLGYFCHDPKT